MNRAEFVAAAVAELRAQGVRTKMTLQENGGTLLKSQPSAAPKKNESDVPQKEDESRATPAGLDYGAPDRVDLSVLAKACEAGKEDDSKETQELHDFVQEVLLTPRLNATYPLGLFSYRNVSRAKTFHWRRWGDRLRSASNEEFMECFHIMVDAASHRSNGAKDWLMVMKAIPEMESKEYLATAALNLTRLLSRGGPERAGEVATLREFARRSLRQGALEGLARDEATAAGILRLCVENETLPMKPSTAPFPPPRYAAAEAQALWEPVMVFLDSKTTSGRALQPETIELCCSIALASRDLGDATRARWGDRACEASTALLWTVLDSVSFSEDFHSRVLEGLQNLFDSAKTDARYRQRFVKGLIDRDLPLRSAPFRDDLVRLVRATWSEERKAPEIHAESNEPKSASFGPNLKRLLGQLQGEGGVD